MKIKLLRIKTKEDAMFSYYILRCCPWSTSLTINNPFVLKVYHKHKYLQTKTFSAPFQE